MRKLNAWAGMASGLLLAGCVSHASMPSETSTGEENYRIDSPAELSVSDDLLNYTNDATGFIDEGDLTAKAVRDAGPALVDRALKAGYNQSELARRCGVSREYIRLLAAGKRDMSFAIQVLLEDLASTKPGS